jgi:protease-4
MRRAWLLAVLGVVAACDPRVFAKNDDKKEQKADSDDDDQGGGKEPQKAEPDDSPSPFGMLGALARAQEPGPFDEPTHGNGYKDGATYAAVLRLEGEVGELEKPFELSLSSLTGRGGNEIALRDLTKRLQEFDKDDKIGALLIRFGDLHMPLAVAEELRGVLAHMKKPVDCHLETGDNTLVLLASACKTVTLAPAGEIALNGPAIAPMYFKGLLDLVGVEADFIHVGAYKGAAEPFTRTEPSPAMLETYNDLVNGAYTRMTTLIAAGRKTEAGKVGAWIDQALFNAEEAKAASIVDGIQPYEAWRDGHGAWKKVHVSEKKNGMEDLMSILGLKPKKKVSGPHVALIYATGEVVDGQGSATGAFSEIASGRLAPAFYAAAANDDIKAIVLRVDSPGGSALAADVIWQAIDVAAAKKPVIVSMGNLAASGGYYISSRAARIFAQPDTLTGSIGVIGGKIVLAPALERIGVHSVELGKGKRAHILSAMHRWTDDERKTLDGTMEHVYVVFKSRVAAGRHVKVEDVEPNAQGRVFLGAEALKRGLVDELGGLDDALAYARKQVKLGEDAAVEVYPQEPSLLESLGGLGGSETRIEAVSEAIWGAQLATFEQIAGKAAARQVAGMLRMLAHFNGDPVRVVAFVPEVRL